MQLHRIVYRLHHLENNGLESNNLNNDRLENNKNIAWYSLEYYPYKSLSQYFVYYTLPLTYWSDVFDRLLGIHQQFVEAAPLANSNDGTVVKNTLDPQQLNNFYTNKLNQRIKEAKTNPELANILNAPSITLNSKTLKGFNSLMPWLTEQIKHLSQNIQPGFMHGDMCFSNILFEPASGIIRLIDPRGDFMGSVNQGDPRYDLAKILHSVHGRYDFIINDLFVLQQDELNFTFNTPQTNYLAQLEQLLFTSLKQQNAFDTNDLILLESLLFLTMLPLHNDQPKRQIAFLLTGLKLLNEVHDATTLSTPTTQSAIPVTPLSALALQI